MTIEEFTALVSKMRDCQIRYFRTRSSTTLQEARDLERRVDKAAAMILAGTAPRDDARQMDLFRRQGA